MLLIRRATIGIVLLAILFLCGFWGAYHFQRSHLKMGEHRIRLNPAAGINSKKQYLLRLWEDEWPEEYGKGYQKYLQGAISDFQKKYPNIKIEVSGLDLLDGPAALARALRDNVAPDLYCSVFRVPPFDYRRQIPVSPYLSGKEIEIYHPALRRIASVDGYLGYFPRWAGLNLWIANRFFLEKAGLRANQIRETGWSWEDMLTLAPVLTEKEFLLVGDPGAAGFGNYLFNQGTLKNGFAENALLEKLKRLKEAAPPPSGFATNMLGLFLSGRAAILAGAGPGLAGFIRNKAQNSAAAGAPVLLPPPRLSSNGERLPVDLGVIAVYRNKKGKGDDQLAAAVKFGQFLSVYRTDFIWREMRLFPAGCSNGVNDADYLFAKKLLERAVVVNSGFKEQWREAARAVEDYLAGKTGLISFK